MLAESSDHDLGRTEVYTPAIFRTFVIQITDFRNSPT